MLQPRQNNTKTGVDILYATGAKVFSHYNCELKLRFVIYNIVPAKNIHNSVQSRVHYNILIF